MVNFNTRSLGKPRDISSEFKRGLQTSEGVSPKDLSKADTVSGRANSRVQRHGNKWMRAAVALSGLCCANVRSSACRLPIGNRIQPDIAMAEPDPLMPDNAWVCDPVLPFTINHTRLKASEHLAEDFSLERLNWEQSGCAIELDELEGTPFTPVLDDGCEVVETKQSPIGGHDETDNALENTKNAEFSTWRQELPESLTPEAIKALRDVSADLHSVSVFEKDGKILVLLGETHIKPSFAARSGEAVLEQFPVRILEGAKPPGPMRPFWKMYFYLLRNIRGLTGGLLDISTIHVAKQQENEIVQGLDVVNIPMEEGHEPSALEKASFIYPNFLLGLTLAEVGLSLFDGYVPTQVKQSINMVSQWHGVQSYLSSVDEFLGYRLSDQPLGVLINPIVGILHGRSETMVKNIVKAIDQTQDNTIPLLAIMGDGHTHKVIDELVGEKNNFKRLYLPGQHQGERLVDAKVREVQKELWLIGRLCRGEVNPFWLILPAWKVLQAWQLYRRFATR